MTKTYLNDEIERVGYTKIHSGHLFYYNKQGVDNFRFKKDTALVGVNDSKPQEYPIISGRDGGIEVEGYLIGWHYIHYIN